MKLLSSLVLALLALCLAPLLSIWSVNTLFSASIGYGLAEWFAALVLMSILNPPKVSL